MTLSVGAYLEKNKLATDEAWLVLLKVTMPDTTVLRITSNSEDVGWPGTAWPGTHTYTAFPFTLGEIGDTSKGEVPSVSLQVSNAARILEPYLDAQDGMVDSSVDIRVVNTMHVVTATKNAVYNATPEIELNYDVVGASSDSRWVNFTLGASNPFNKRFPRNKIYRNICRYREFKGIQCQYIGSETTCDRTLDTCRGFGNTINFGGCPGVTSKGIYI